MKTAPSIASITPCTSNGVEDTVGWGLSSHEEWGEQATVPIKEIDRTA